MTEIETDPVRHRDDCPSAVLHEFYGNLGDRVVRCRGCGRFTPTPPVDSDAPPPAEEMTLPGTKLVCRPHYLPVNFKGRGCRFCDRGRA